jgi:hypothetical protein
VGGPSAQALALEQRPLDDARTATRDPSASAEQDRRSRTVVGPPNVEEQRHGDGRTPTRRTIDMKSMTCEQLGGPCTHEHHGASADEVIKAQDRHLKDAVANGDAAHSGALSAMKGRWRNPIGGFGWYRQVKRDFAALPES